MNNSLLLDTHIFIWLLTGNNHLSIKARQAIEICTKAEGKILLSAISV